MKKLSLVCVAVCIGILAPNLASAKELGSRLGVGFRNSYAFDLPSLAVHYFPSSDLGVVGALGVDTEDQNAKFALSGGVRKILFKEDNLNFFMGGVLSLVSKETAGTTDSGFELAALVGSEFFFQGLDNLGFNFESGVAVTNVKKVRFRTMGDSFLRAGIIFYF